ncbi:hypothetical protein [Xanthomonas sacchari]|uniref:hypothetical protein n=1 Tax=Xanthomonas sacchari TaxID=56458 RepID=UPI00299F530E|nr:hypothetical protein [Xanthomonas sacchari]
MAEQVGLVLEALSYPVQRTDTTRGAWSNAAVQAAPDASNGPFLVTQMQIDRLTLLVQTVSANARAATEEASERAGQASPEVGDTLCTAVSEVRELLVQIACQPVRTATSNRVREGRPVYAVERVAPQLAGERLH